MVYDETVVDIDWQSGIVRRFDLAMQSGIVRRFDLHG